MDTEPRSIVKRAMSYGFDEAVVNTYDVRRAYIRIAHSKIDSVVEKSDKFGYLFVSSKKRSFTTDMEKLDSASVASSIRKSRQMISSQDPKEDYFGIAQGPFKYKKNGIVDNKIKNYGANAIDIANAAIQGALYKGADSVAGMLRISHSISRISTSKDVDASDVGTSCRLSLRIFGSGTSFQDVYASRRLSDIRSASFGGSIANVLDSARGNGRIKGGEYDVIYMPSPAGLLLSNVNYMACIGNVETGSFLANKVGTAVANKNLSLYDDGASSTGIGSIAFDMEGHPTQKTTLIKDGVLKGFLHNHSTAKKYEAKSTGNAGLVLPDPNMTVIEHRKKVDGIEDLIKDVDKGILVTNTWYTRFSNYLSGDFSTVPRDIAIYIKNGEPMFYIKQGRVESMVGIRISDNMIRMLKNTEKVANDSRQTSSWDYGDGYYVSPSILVRGVKVTTA